MDENSEPAPQAQADHPTSDKIIAYPNGCAIFDPNSANVTIELVEAMTELAVTSGRSVRCEW